MRRAEISLENAPALAEYYGGKRSRRAFMAVFHAAMPYFVKVQSYYDVGAEAGIEEHLNAGKQLFVVHNHQDWNDPMVLGTMMQKERVLRRMRHHSRIAARMGMFKLGGSVPNWLFGWYVRHSRAAVPLVVPNDQESENTSAIRAVNEVSEEILTDDLNRGLHVFMYPEGSRHESADVDPLYVWPFFEGMGRILTSVERPEDVKVLSIGTHYHPGTHHREATSFITEPRPVDGLALRIITASTREVLQYAVNKAAELAHRA